ncbi:MAG: hypothetical protein IPM40_18720 [Gammaproteobacteria bacterium]|nr:hypothetical protein [Gammaproteobacteria bacterium]
MGLLVALLLLVLAESALHFDVVLHRMRSVFAAGRALEKVLHVEATAPDLLMLGNSRADNAFDPETILHAMGPGSFDSAFNTGAPGADAAVINGMLRRLDAAGVLGGDGVESVVLSLDETLLQSVDTLGQKVFFANRRDLLMDHQFHDWIRSIVRLYGFSDNFRQLREPATLQRFLVALRRDTDPVGGAAAEHRGYRAGVGGLQDHEALLRQEAGSGDPPATENLRNLWRIMDLLELRGVQIVVVFPPLLNRNVLFLEPARVESAPYLAILDELERRRIPIIVLDRKVPRNPAEFVNAGHLNDLGAQRYSAMLGRELRAVLPIAKSP